MGLSQLIAHRGYAHRYPENTLPALNAAVQAGAKYVEFDIQLTANRTPVLLHDADLKRTTGVEGCIHDLTDDDLRGISAHEPQRLGDRFTPTAIPSLSDACQAMAATPAVTCFIELKEESITAFGADVFVNAVMEVLTRQSAPERWVLISYHLDILLAARQNGWPSVGWVLHTWDDASQRTAEQHQPQYLFCNTRKIPQTDRPFWLGPWQWAVYEVADVDTAIAWGQRGADFVETFRIADLLADPRWTHDGGTDAEL